MNILLRRLLVGITVSISLLLCACGGESETQLGGIDGSGSPVTAGTLSVSSGAINGFGSVIVNGVRYNSDKAKILINDQLVTEDSLHTGYQVKVTGTVTSDGSATAEIIEFHPNLSGVISHINVATQEFTLLGQSVQVNSTTVFDIAITPNYLEGLKIGDKVLVSGSFDDKGVITATRVERTINASYQIMGYISNTNEANFNFTVKNLTINYSAAALNNFNNNRIADGLLVVATGSLDSKGVFQAKTLVRINNSFDKTIKDSEVEGFITRYLSVTDFDVAGITATTNTQTTFENGTSANMGLGVALSIKGSVNSTGLLVVEKIEFKKSDNNEIAGEVATTSTVNNGNITTGTLQIGNTNIQTNSRTAFEDKGNSALKRFNMGDIRAGDFVKISGYTTSQGVFIATKIERQEVKSDNATELKFNGIIISTESHSFVLYGRNIFTDSSTEFKGTNGETLTETQFYQQAIGQRVQVEGLLKNGAFTATKVRFDVRRDD